MRVEDTEFRGLFVVSLDVPRDERGSFREVWHLQKLAEGPLSDFQPVQQNISVSQRAVVRGIHAEPWNKYIHAAHGEAFVALVDMRSAEPTFGKTFSHVLDGTQSIFVPEGFGNSFQALSSETVYSYLVDAHWRPGVEYQAVAYDDPDLDIAWPIEDAIVSEKDRGNPSWGIVRAKLLK